MELFFFENPLYLSLFEHRKRTVTLYQNYRSNLTKSSIYNKMHPIITKCTHFAPHFLVFAPILHPRCAYFCTPLFNLYNHKASPCSLQAREAILIIHTSRRREDQLHFHNQELFDKVHSLFLYRAYRQLKVSVLYHIHYLQPFRRKV